jgi:hypothetical protein
MSRVIQLVSTFAWIAAASFAAPPFLTDDADAGDFGGWEIDLGSQWHHEADESSATLPHLDLNYTVLPDVQLHLLLARAMNQPAGEARRDGYGDTEFGIKYRVVQESSRLPAIAIFPTFEIPTGNDKCGLGGGHTAVFLPIWFEKNQGDWSVSGGGGYWFNPGVGNRNWWTYGVLFKRRLGKSLCAGAEILRQTPSEIDGSSSTVVNFGTAWELDDVHSILASYGVPLRGASGYQFYLALQFNLAPRREAHHFAGDALARASR